MDSPSTQHLGRYFFWRGWHPQVVVISVTVHNNILYRLRASVASLLLVILSWVGTTRADAQSLISPLQPMAWQLGTWEATFPDGKWTVSFTAQLKGTMIQIQGSHSNGNQIHGMRFYDKKEKTVRTVFLNSKGDYWENKGSLFKDKTIFRAESLNEDGEIESHVGMDIRRDDETYTFIRIQIDAQGRVNQMPSTEHKRIAAEPAPKNSE